MFKKEEVEKYIIDEGKNEEKDIELQGTVRADKQVRDRPDHDHNSGDHQLDSLPILVESKC